jgi:hypothetical protein
VNFLSLGRDQKFTLTSSCVATDSWIGGTAVQLTSSTKSGMPGCGRLLEVATGCFADVQRAGLWLGHRAALENLDRQLRVVNGCSI